MHHLGKKDNVNKEKQILEQIKNIESNLNNDKLEELQILREELNSLRDKQLEGFMIRSRVKDILEGEKPSNYFCNLEKNAYTSKTINILQSDDGKNKTNQAEILKECEKFYANIFKEKNKFSNSNFTDFTNGISAPKLTMSEQVKLEGLNTYKEASQVLHKMKNNKTLVLLALEQLYINIYKHILE